MSIFRKIGNKFKGLMGATAVDAGEMYNPNAAAFSETREEMDYLNHLRQNVYGEGGPSVAENMLNRQASKISDQMGGAIGSTRGVQNPALLARQAAATGSGMMQDAAGQAATLRAQEQLAQQDALQQQLGVRQDRQMQLEAMKAGQHQSYQDRQFQSRQGRQERRAALIGGLGSSGATMMSSGGTGGGAAAGGAAAAGSDISLKENIEPADTDGFLDYQYRKMLDQLHPSVYDYKDKSDGKGKRMGVMAQDLEKSEMGKGMVETKDGKKNINVDISTILAGQAGLNERLNKIEGQGDMKASEYYEKYGELPPIDVRGSMPKSQSENMEGYRPRNMQDFPSLENPPNQIQEYPMQQNRTPQGPSLENPPKKVPTSPIKAKKMVDDMSNKERKDYLSYLVNMGA